MPVAGIKLAKLFGIADTRYNDIGMQWRSLYIAGCMVTFANMVPVESLDITEITLHQCMGVIPNSAGVRFTAGIVVWHIPAHGETTTI